MLARVHGKPNQRIACCPFCLHRVGKIDTDFHLGIDLKRGIYHCYRCDASGKFKNVNEILPFNIEIDTEEPKDLFDVVKTLNKNPIKVRQYQPLNLKEFSDPITTDTPFAIMYLEERGYNPSIVIPKYNIRAGKKYVDEMTGITRYKWFGRIIVPIMWNKIPVYAVGRDYTGTNHIKYVNVTRDKEGLFFNIDSVRDEAILCEGIFSALAAEHMISKPAVASLGKFITDDQFIVLRSRAKNLWISLDGDVNIDELSKAINRALYLGFSTKVVLLPKEKDRKDPDALGSSYKEFFESAVTINDITDLALLKLRTIQ